MFVAGLENYSQEALCQADRAWTGEDVSCRSPKVAYHTARASFYSGSDSARHIFATLINLLTLHPASAFFSMIKSMKAAYNCAVLSLIATASVVAPTAYRLALSEAIENPKIRLCMAADETFEDAERRILGLVERDLPRSKKISLDRLDSNGNVISGYYEKVDEEIAQAAANGAYATLKRLVNLRYPELPQEEKKVRALHILDNMHQGVCSLSAAAIEMGQMQLAQSSGATIVPVQGGQRFTYGLHIDPETHELTFRGHVEKDYAVYTGENHFTGSAPVRYTLRSDFVHEEVFSEHPYTKFSLNVADFDPQGTQHYPLDIPTEELVMHTIPTT